jgi:hypothetical protein
MKSIRNFVVVMNERSHSLERDLKQNVMKLRKKNQRLKPKLYNRLKFLYGMNVRINRTFC